MNAKPVEDRLDAERALALARLLLAAATLVTSRTVAPGALAASTPLAAYVAWATLTLLALRLRPGPALRAAPAIHIVDTAWAATLPLLWPDQATTFLAAFVFVLVAAGLRWGAVATLASGLAMLSAALAPLVGVTLGAPEPDWRVAHRVSELLVVTSVLAVVLSLDRRRRVARAFLHETVTHVARASGLATALRALLANSAVRFGADAGAVVLHDVRRDSLWLLGSSGSTLQPTGLPGSDRPALVARSAAEARVFLFEVPGPNGAWYVHGDAEGGARGLSVCSADGTHVTRFDARRSLSLMKHAGTTSVLGADAEVSGEWRARLLLFGVARPSAGQLRLLRSLASAVAPLLHRQYQQRRVRSRVAATERNRLAGELHDGLLQSMIGVELQLEVLRKHASRGDATLEPLVRGVRDVMRQCVAEARDVMQALRPQPVTGRQVLRLIAEHADRLRDEGGIDVRLLTSITDLDCPPRTCVQLARIVQEAFANARKHSGARTITVNLSQATDVYRMIVEDDGRGLRFEGRRTLAQLDASESGPAVIKDRVRAIGGRLAIDSEPGRGTRVVIEWPRERHA